MRTCWSLDDVVAHDRAHLLGRHRAPVVRGDVVTGGRRRRGRRRRRAARRVGAVGAAVTAAGRSLRRLVVVLADPQPTSTAAAAAVAATHPYARRRMSASSPRHTRARAGRPDTASIAVASRCPGVGGCRALNRRSWTLFALMGAIWGVPYLFIKVAVEHLAPPVVVFGRTAVAIVPLLIIAARAGAIRPALARWRPLLAFAALEMAIPWLLLTDAERRLPSGLTGLLIACVPIVGAVVAFALGDRQALAPRRVVGIALGLGGVALLVADRRQRHGVVVERRRGPAGVRRLRDGAVHRVAPARRRPRRRRRRRLADRGGDRLRADRLVHPARQSRRRPRRCGP